MPAKRETQEYVKSGLPYDILREIYKDSRVSLQELGRRFNISYHNIAAALKELEKRYDIEYTLELDEAALGFTEGRIITIKFENPAPSIDFLRERFTKDIFVQDAYLATGDFDLLLYVVGITSKDFKAWEWRLRMDLGEYRPVFKSSIMDEKSIGFLALRSELIKESPILSNSEKKVLMLLNNNSRARLKEICEKCKIKNPMHVVYILRKLKEKGIIKKFSALTQKPDKKIISAYGLRLIPTKEHHHKFFINFAKELLNETASEITNDYCFIADVTGAYDGMYLCTFEDGERLSKRGPDLIQRLWAVESPRIDRAMLTYLIIGKWPFHLEEYESYKRLFEKESK
ncbi:MAG: Lrp/AsnC family transcriptional regulator [Candidatus Micrarchaeota archaeon]|nr:Lrp/AsnC family transcriptional regulator [Candidatus Micrarchaeota archaeon]